MSESLKNAKYIIVKGANEDGETVYFEDDKSLNEVLNGEVDPFDPELFNLTFGEQLHFLSEIEFRQLKETNPQHWEETDAILLRIEKIIVPKPKIVKSEFTIEDEEEK